MIKLVTADKYCCSATNHLAFALTCMLCICSLSFAGFRLWFFLDLLLRLWPAFLFLLFISHSLRFNYTRFILLWSQVSLLCLWLLLMRWQISLLVRFRFIDRRFLKWSPDFALLSISDILLVWSCASLEGGDLLLTLKVSCKGRIF